MPPVDLPGVFRTRLIVQNPNTRLGYWSTQLDFDSAGATAVDEAAVAEAVADAWQAVFDTIVAGTATIEGRFSNANTLPIVEAFELVPGGPAAVTRGVAGTTFSVTGQALPVEVAVCISKRTGLRGRANRGRSYLGCLQESSLAADARFSGSFVSALDVAMDNEFKTAGIGGGLTPVVVSQAEGDRAVPIVSFTVDTRPDTQRRRGPRG